jgi:hypothetical protein
VGKDAGNPILMGIAQKQPSRFTPYLTEALASFAYRRGVDQGQHALDISREQGVEEGLVGVLKLAQKSVLFESGGQAVERPQTTLDLILQSADVRRQQTVQPEEIALFFGEGCALVQHWLVDQVVAGE